MKVPLQGEVDSDVWLYRGRSTSPQLDNLDKCNWLDLHNIHMSLDRFDPRRWSNLDPQRGSKRPRALGSVGGRTDFVSFSKAGRTMSWILS